MDKWFVFEIYQSCVNMGSVGLVSVWVAWCEWCLCRMGGGLSQGLEV